MTGRELIVYIMQNGLEDEVIFKDLLTEEQAAIKFDVGVATIKIWHEMGMLNSFESSDGRIFVYSKERVTKKEATNGQEE